MMSDRYARYKQDLYRILAAITPNEVQHILDNARAGRIDGAWYWPDTELGTSCGCVVGAVVEYRKIEKRPDDQDDIDAVCTYLSNALGFEVEPHNPIEYYIAGVQEGDTLDASEELANIEAWIVAWQTEHEVQS